MTAKTIGSDNGPQFTGVGVPRILQGQQHWLYNIDSIAPETQQFGLRGQDIQTVIEGTKRRIAPCSCRHFLSSFQTAPQKMTGRSLAGLFYGRPISTRLDLLKPGVHRCQPVEVDNIPQLGSSGKEVSRRRSSLGAEARGLWARARHHSLKDRALVLRS